jgi:MFS family permease
MSRDIPTPGAPLWRHRAFLHLWAAQSLSAFGSRITRTAIPIIAISTLAVTPGQAALLSALGFAPILVAGLFGGGYVERARKVRLMVMLDLVRFALVMAIPVAFALGVQSFWLLLVLSMLISLAGALFQNADVSILPRIVSDDQLVDANGKLQATESIAELSGPGVAGVLIDLVTAPVAVILDAFTFLWSAFWLRGVARHAPQADARSLESGPRPHPLQELRDDFAIGAAAVLDRPALRALVIGQALFYVSAGFAFGLYMLFALRNLGLGPGVLGLIISMGGLSALGGALLARRLATWLGFGPAIVATFAIGMVGNALLLPAVFRPEWGAPLLIAQQLLSDGAFMAHMILAASLRQKLLPADTIARANGFFQAMGGFGMLGATLVGGAAAEAFGVGLAVVIGSATALVAILPMLSPALLALRREPEAETASREREAGEPAQGTL